MLLLSHLFASLSATPGALSTTLGSLVQFIELAAKLQPVILHRAPLSWDSSVPPADLPSYILDFMSCHLGTSEECVQQLWTALGSTIWSTGKAVLEGAGDGGDGGADEWALEDMDSDHVECKALYYPNYVVHDGVRQYYDDIPEYIQVSGHKFIERQVLEHFTMLSVLSWTSSTNAAHIYQQSMAKLSEDAPEDSRFRLRAAHTADGFLILALLKDAKDRGVVLEVPSTGHQKDRFTAAVHIAESGQPEFAHWCTKCVRRFDDADGVTRYVDCIITDGIDMGRPCCGEHNCRGELRTPQDRWCVGHQGQELFCVVEGCCMGHRVGHRTCELHCAIEEHYIATGKAMFTLRARLQRAQVAHPTDAINPNTPINEEIEADIPGPCPEKPAEGNQRVRARFGRRRTHNEQLIVRPCGIITSRETFYGSESIPQVVDMVKRRHLVPNSMPRFLWYDNNCGVYKYCAANHGEDLHLKIGLPVDVFHWKCKHKKTDIECSYHCNPYKYPELLKDNTSGFFNSSRAEQTNVWFGGYHAIFAPAMSV
ncbi:hypothetical protein TRAPUB_6808 [Trametes pubescens]|uniref:CxC6 like cysteine cluster associated with KDZ domain-containing protein n=1 Tax=Trametes pubescens TaxID=154538 RepID=A0A1M2V512_TRAPU|nr:hypothetical protein TRAPUB_6808 [Trametes pubescens]